ncbi:MAG: hypothetical protein AABX77_02350 [Nanoarchaeota archaeon]
MNYDKLGLYAALVFGGLTGGIFLGLSPSPKPLQPRNSAVTHVYTANIDCNPKTDNVYDDVVVRKASGEIEFYFSDSKGNLTSGDELNKRNDELKKKELSDLVKIHDEELKKIKENFDGIRSKLNSK